MTNETQTTLDAALAYAELGWSVVPVVPGEKQPLIAWTAFQKRRANAKEIRDWFKRWPRANIAIVTGAVSGLVVIDIDPRHGGEASLKALEDEVGPIPSTLEARSGGGGRHLYFVHPGPTIRNRAGFRPGIDLRGDGGVILAPPSLHPSGRHYTWVSDHGPRQASAAMLPQPLLAALMAEGDGRGHSLDYWRALVAAGVCEGERNTTIASLAGHLLWHAVDPDVVRELLCCWNRVRCRPPLPDKEVVRTVASIRRLHNRQAAANDPRADPRSGQ